MSLPYDIARCSGDILVILVPQHLTPEEYQNLHVQQSGVKALILDRSMTPMVVRKEPT